MKKLFLTMALVFMASVQTWCYTFTNNYTIETKFKINAIGAGIIFSACQGQGGNLYMWQYNVGENGDRSLFRPHHWNPGALLEEKGTGDVTLNTTDWFITKIEITNGSHARTYLRKAADDVDVLIDERDGDFRYGMIGTRQDHDGNTNESASFDYFKITDDDSQKILYFEDFDETDGNWTNNPIWEDGTLRTDGVDLSERRYFPDNMFKQGIDMHYAVEADLTIEKGYISIIFGLNENGSNYMWQISPNYYNDGSANIYYHLDRGNEQWKAHAAGARFPDFNAEDFLNPHHIKIEVDGNVVYTYIDDKLQDTFKQNDITDLELLNLGGIGFRADGSNNIEHKSLIDNIKVTTYDTEGEPTVVLYDNFTGGQSRYFNLDVNELTSVVNNQLVIDVPAGSYAARLLQEANPLVSLLISENEDNTNLPVLMGSDITLKKTFVANQWNTLCLPFALSAEQLTSLFGEDSRVAALSNIDASTSSFFFSSITTGTEAGKPYLVFPTKDINDPIELTGIDLVCEEATSETHEGFAFCGLLAPMSTTADGKTFYLLGDNYNLKKATEEENMPALGAYFTVPEETTDALLFIDNISTDIRTVGNQKLHDNIQSFDLQGRHVNMSQTKKGIYIKSGKKFVK